MINAHMTPLFLREDGQICTGEDDCDGTCRKWGTLAQFMKLYNLCQRYHVEFRFGDYTPTPFGESYMVEGWVGGKAARALYVGVEPNGDSHS